MRRLLKIATFLLFISPLLSELHAQDKNTLLIEKIAQIEHITGELSELRDSLQKGYNSSDKKNTILKSFIESVDNFDNISKFLLTDTLQLDHKLEMLDTYRRSAITLIMLLEQTKNLDLPLIVDYKEYQKEASKKDYILTKDEYILNQSQINYEIKYSNTIFGNRRNYYDKKIVRITTEKGETRVDLAMYINRDNQGISISENSYLRDKKDGVLYKIRRIEREIPLAKVLVIPDSRGEYISFTLIFPPLGEDVKKLEFVTAKSNICLNSRYELQLQYPLEYDMRLKSNNLLQIDKIIE